MQQSTSAPNNIEMLHGRISVCDADGGADLELLLAPRSVSQVQWRWFDTISIEHWKASFQQVT